LGGHAKVPPMSELGQKAKYSLRVHIVRFTPDSGLKSDIAPFPRSATSGLMQCSKKDRYSITSSARRRIEVGNETPIALAVLRFTVNA
jgi:hypothetical protein